MEGFDLLSVLNYRDVVGVRNWVVTIRAFEKQPTGALTFTCFTYQCDIRNSHHTRILLEYICCERDQIMVNLRQA
jgi:hypothetical protein